MRTLALLVLLGCAAIAQAQQPKTYTPGTAPRPNEETILNARVVSVDPAAARLTVRGVDVKADGGRDETFTVAAPAASQLAGLKRGAEVLLVLRGTTVVEIKLAVASGGEGGTVPQGTGKTTPGTITLRGSPAAPSPATKASASPTKRAGASPRTTAAPRTAVTPRPTVTPQAGAAPGTGMVGTNPRTPVTKGVGVIPGPVPPGTTVGVGGAVVATPTPALYATPFPTPRPQPTPIPVGTPRPVLLPSEGPSPSQTPTPSPSPQTP